MNHEQMVEVLRGKQGELSLRQFAAKIGFSAAYLSDVMSGKRQGGKALLRKFGMSKKVTVTVEYHKNGRDGQ